MLTVKQESKQFATSIGKEGKQILVDIKVALIIIVKQLDSDKLVVAEC
jgi:hypothetical protein